LPREYKYTREQRKPQAVIKTNHKAEKNHRPADQEHREPAEI